MLQEYQEKILKRFLPIASMQVSTTPASAEFAPASTQPGTPFPHQVISKVENLTVEYKKIVSAADISKKFTQIDIIDDELISEKDRQIAEQLLSPFLTDSEKSVRIRAAKVLYKFNPYRSLEIFSSLLYDEDEKIVIDTVSALSEISSPECIDKLITVADKASINVQKEIVRTLYNKSKDKELSAEVVKKINDFITKMKYKTRWIIE